MSGLDHIIIIFHINCKFSHRHSLVVICGLHVAEDMEGWNVCGFLRLNCHFHHIALHQGPQAHVQY